jgi:septum formation protein
MIHFGNKKLILSSNSPRRKELLELADIVFSVECREADESFPLDMSVNNVAEFIAVQKSVPWKGKINQGEIILTADSVVILEEEIMGKPKDANHAFEMLQKLSGKVHRVITGCCILDSKNQKSFSDITEVHFHHLSNAEINYYIENYKPFDKAGAYGIQEWIGLNRVKEIRGSWSNVVGLPVHKVYSELISFLESH